MKDTTRTLTLVAGLGVVLVAGIAATLQLGRDRLIDEEQAKAEIKAISTEIQATEPDDASREQLIRKLPRTMAQRKEKGKDLPEESQKDLAEVYKALTPEQQALFITSVLPQMFASELAKFNAKYKTPDEREAAVNKIVTDLKTEFDKRTEKELWESRESIESKQGKAYLGTVQKFFEGNLSSDQRSEFEPVMREVLRQVKALREARRPPAKK